MSADPPGRSTGSLSVRYYLKIRPRLLLSILPADPSQLKSSFHEDRLVLATGSV